MNRESVKSSMIASIGFDLSTSTLEIEFNSGTVWQYFKVSKKVFNEMKSASSCGRFFLNRIKDEYDELQVG